MGVRLAIVYAAMSVLAATTPGSTSGPTLAGCPVFPLNNPWNQKVTNLLALLDENLCSMPRGLPRG